MLVDVHIIAWNEAETIRLTIKHYQKISGNITIHDNWSSDGTDRIALEMGCRVVKFGKPGELSDKEYRKIKNNVWKGSVADWVIVCDADEILDVSEARLSAATTTGKTIFKTYGWQVFSENMPTDSFSELTNGFHDTNYSKTVIFNPKEIVNINFDYGAHSSCPEGRIEYADNILTLFHYRNIGGADRLVQRHREYRRRLSPLNKELGLGIHYCYSDERRVREWQEQLKKSGTYSPVGF